MKTLLRLSLVFLYFIVFYCQAESAFEQEDHHAQHQHHAHEHGVAHMNLIGDKKKISIELTIPMLDVTGFEHKPETDQQQTILNNKIAAINKIDAWLVINQQAECQLTHHAMQVDSATKHPDINLDIEFLCNKPDSLKKIQVNIFDQLESLEKIESQWVIAGNQSATTLTKTGRNILVTQ